MLAMILLYAPSNIFAIYSKLAPATSYLKQSQIIYETVDNSICDDVRKQISMHVLC